jgi:hypothetical protein
MGQRYRRGFTAAEKTELWDRWQRGESLKAIGRAFGKPSSSIYFQVAPHGGIRPSPRRRSRLALTLAEREEISRGIAAYQSTRSMAKLLGHSQHSRYLSPRRGRALRIWIGAPPRWQYACSSHQRADRPPSALGSRALPLRQAVP